MSHIAILSLILIYFFSDIPSDKNKKKFFCILSAICLVLISGLRGVNMGYDTENYLDTFHASANISWGEIFKSFFSRYFSPEYLERDPGFMLVEKTIGFVTNNDQIYLILIAIITIVPITAFVYSQTNSKKELLLSLTYYVSFYFSYIPNSSIRQSVALSILLIAYKFLGKDKIIPCLIAVFFASTIHKTALIFVFLVILHILKLNKAFFRFAPVIFVFFLLTYEQFAPFITLVFGDAYSSYASSSYFAGEQRSFTFIIFLTLIYIMTLVPVLLRYEKDFYSNKLMYLSAGMAFVLTPFMLIDPTFLRVTVYFAIFNFVLIPHSIQLYKPLMSKIIYLSIFLLLVFSSIMTWDAYNFYWE